MLNNEKLNSVIGNMAKIFTDFFYSTLYWTDLIRTVRKKKNKKNTDWKERNKAVFICGRHQYVKENPKKSTKNLLELISELNKVARYSINVQNYTYFYILANKQ